MCWNSYKWNYWSVPLKQRFLRGVGVMGGGSNPPFLRVITHSDIQAMQSNWFYTFVSMQVDQNRYPPVGFPSAGRASFLFITFFFYLNSASPKCEQVFYPMILIIQVMNTKFTKFGLISLIYSLYIIKVLVPLYHTNQKWFARINQFVKEIHSRQAKICQTMVLSVPLWTWNRVNV